MGFSPMFTTYQREAINFKDLPIEFGKLKSLTTTLFLMSKFKRLQQKKVLKQFLVTMLQWKQ